MSATKHGPMVVTPAPCGKCPFRKDVPIYLRAERRQQIIHSITQEGSDFHCHQHLVEGEDDEGETTLLATSESPICAGAAKALLMENGSTQVMRSASSLGLIDLDEIERRGADVWGLDVWARIPEGETADTFDVRDLDEIETCSVVDHGCHAPAGMLGPGGIERGTVAAELRCAECDEPVCENCQQDGICNSCREWEED